MKWITRQFEHCPIIDRSAVRCRWNSPSVKRRMRVMVAVANARLGPTASPMWSPVRYRSALVALRIVDRFSLRLIGRTYTRLNHRVFIPTILQRFQRYLPDIVEILTSLTTVFTGSYAHVPESVPRDRSDGALFSELVKVETKLSA